MPARNKTRLAQDVVRTGLPRAAAAAAKTAAKTAVSLESARARQEFRPLPSAHQLERLTLSGLRRANLSRGRIRAKKAPARLS